MKLKNCPTFQKGTLRLPTPQPRFVHKDWGELGFVGSRELWLDLDVPHGNDMERLKDSACEARIETLRYRSSKTTRRSAGFVLVRDGIHYDTDGNALPQRNFTYDLSDPANFSTSPQDEGELVGRVPFWSLYRKGQIYNYITKETFDVPVVMGEHFSNNIRSPWVPQWSGGKMDLYLRFRVSMLNEQGIREAGPESVTVRVAPYPYPIHMNGGSNTTRIGVGMADGPIYG